MNRIVLVGGIIGVAVLAAGGALYVKSQNTHKTKPLATPHTQTSPAESSSSASTATPAAPPSQPAATPPASSASNNSSVTITNKSSQTTNGQTTIQPQTLNVTVDDTSASQTTFNVTKGAEVTINFHVGSNTYHGGLEFKGGGLDTGAIAPGSTRTLKFTANSSITFIPYWPASGVQKPYTVTVTGS